MLHSLSSQTANLVRSHGISTQCVDGGGSVTKSRGEKKPRVKRNSPKPTLALSIDANLFSTKSKRELARKCVAAVQYRHGGEGADAGLDSHTMKSGMLFFIFIVESKLTLRNIIKISL